jgi:simple sugar transport system substrate-binding protein/ribose transport system substrate-binding protein
LQYAKDAAMGVVLKPGDAGGGAPALQNVSFTGDSNLGDPIVAPFVTKTALHLTTTPVDGMAASFSTTPVSDAALWGNVYGKAHGGVCSGSTF